MRKIFLPFTFFSIFLCLFLTCKKEYSYENNKASGSLQDSLDGCLPKEVFGMYFLDSSLNNSNYLQVEVKVDKPGTYTIYTDTVNGYYFRTQGVFDATGLFTVVLPGFGKPVNYGTNSFTVFFDTSICNFSISLTDTTILPADYAFLGDSCTIDSLLGFYIQGVPVSDTSRLSFPADVKSPGSYKIYTDTVDGYSFFASGVFTKAGLQNVTLRCFGAPQHVGTDLFKVTADSATCYFTVNVLLPVIPVSNDHFPLLPSSYWSYNDTSSANDTIVRKLNTTASFNGNTYQVFAETDQRNHQDLSYYRKSGNNYYEYCSGDKYTTAVKFKAPVYGDLFFLKETIRAGDGWASDEFTGTADNNQQKKIQYNFKCLEDNSYYIVNGVAFSNVYVIQMLPIVRSQNGNYAPTGEAIYTYYARGIGIIYQQVFAPDDSSVKMQLRNWYIN